MQALNISERNKVITWTPAHTASRLASKIFDNFDFDSYDVNKGGTFLKKGFEHNHYIGLPKNHQEYKLIMTCRNPYTSVTAGFDGDNAQERLQVSLEEAYQDKYHLDFMTFLRYRTPDYFIRVENLLEDYLKIPFIRYSKFYTSGEMQKLIDDNPFKAKVYIKRPIITQQLADLIYYNNSYYFELLGYDRNSWKK